MSEQNNKLKSTGIADLLKKAESTNNTVQNIKSVQNNSLSESTDLKESEFQKPLSEKKSLTEIDYLFQQFKIDGTEAVRIPADIHKRLKLLASLSNCPISQILANILSNYFSDNQKEIQAYIKKNI
jgi:hypothetical protein